MALTAAPKMVQCGAPRWCNVAGAAMTNGVPFSASIELSSPALTVPARKSYRFSVQTVHRCFHTDPVLPLGGILTCVPSPIRHSNSGAHNLAAQRREVSHITASQLTFLSEPAETILPQPSTSYQSESAPESTRVPARTARRRARKKEAAINPQADLAAGNQLTDPVEWAGLATWRAEEVDESRGLGKEGPEAGVQLRLEEGETHEFVLADTLAECGRQVLQTRDPLLKSLITHAAFRAYKAGKLPVGEASAPDTPSRPDKPALVPPREVPPPKRAPLPLNAYMLHNLAHIELNAIDLAWDTLVRFSPLRAQLGEAFFADFAHVADDESRHLGWVLQRLAELGHAYGDMPAHDLLWRDALKTSGDVTARLAVVPMVQEARGLDAGPRSVDRLKAMGDARSAIIVDKIAEEELAHVAVGVTWFLHVCRRSGVEPGASFQGLIQEYCQDTLKGPFNHAARAVAGVPRHWYDTSAPPPRNGERSSALESKAKLEAKRRDAKLSGGGGIVGLESGSEGLGQGEDSIAETSGVSSEGFGANGVRLRGLLVDGVGVDVRSTTNGREPAGGVGHSNPETDESVRRGETKGSGRVGNSEDGEVKVRASIRDLRTNEMTSSAASCEDGHFPERGLQRNGKLPETETKVATHSGHGESTIVNEPTGTRAELFPSRADAPDSGQSSSPHSSRSREDSPAQPDSSRIRKAESEGDLRSGKHERGEVASDAEPLPDEDIEALSQVRERLAWLVAMEQERASA